MKTLMPLVSVLWALSAVSALAGPQPHERLRVRNDFRLPEEVVQYYVARDADGFVWAGMLEAELKAFTLWKAAPQQDSYLLARRYSVQAARPVGKDEAEVDVVYELSGTADAHGTWMFPVMSERTVTFNLRKVGKVWKIALPVPGQLIPVVIRRL